MTATFTLNLPVDSGCRILINFPTEQPLTSALTSVSGTGLFSNAGSLVTSTAAQTATIDGCPSHQDSGQSATINLV
jgi:hypothetical protein